MHTENRFYSFVLLIIVVLLDIFRIKRLTVSVPHYVGHCSFAHLLSVYAYILRYVKYRSIASVITLLIIILLLIGPFSYFAYALSQELINLMDHFQDQNGKGNILQSLLAHPLVNSLVQKVLSWFKISEKELYNTVSTSLIDFVKQSTGLIKAGFAICWPGDQFCYNAVLDIFLPRGWPGIYREAGRFHAVLEPAAPQASQADQRHHCVHHLRGIVVGMTQGLIGGTTFAIIGIHSPVFWGLAMFVTSFLPIVGSFIIWGPAVVYLLFEEMYLKAVVLLVVGSWQ